MEADWLADKAPVVDDGAAMPENSETGTGVCVSSGFDDPNQPIVSINLLFCWLLGCCISGAFAVVQSIGKYIIMALEFGMEPSLEI